MPKAEVSITCKVPEDRTGYHVIYGVWKIADTRNNFYQAVDVNLAAKTEPTKPSTMQLTEPVTSPPTKPVTTLTTGPVTTQPTTPVGTQLSQ